MTTFSAASATDVGNSRASNQDAVYASDRLCIVADGMGGHAGGEVAAESAVAGLIAAFEESPSAKGLMAGAKRVNREIYRRSDLEEELRGMGTTLVAVALARSRHSEKIALINVGDSRAYLFEEGELTRLTEDHSLVEEMLRNGEISQAEAEVHPYRHVLTRAVGIEDRVDVDAWTLTPVSGTRVLLCSDGLTNEVTDDEIAEILTDNPEPADACYALIRRALDHGGNDNVTVVVTDIVSSKAAVPKKPPARGQQPSPPIETLAAAPVELPEDPIANDEDTHVEELNQAALTTQRSSAQRSRDPIPPRVSAPRDTPPTQRPSPQRRRALRGPGDGPITFRVALFCFLLVVVIAGSFGFTLWFNKATYYVGIDHQHVAIYNGRPGGFLWFTPTLVTEYPLKTSQVLPANLTLLREGMLESSLSTARRAVGNLTNELASIAAVTATNNAGSTTHG